MLSASLVATITSPDFSGHDGLLFRCLAVTSQAQERHGIDESCSDIKSPAKLTGGIIKREGVVEVVEALT